MARPRFKPSTADFKNVELFAAYGAPEDQIAGTIGPRGISPKTLRKYFHRELAPGMMKANAKVAQTLYQLATSGECVSATIFWNKVRMKCNVRGWAQSVAPSEIEEETE